MQTILHPHVDTPPVADRTPAAGRSRAVDVLRGLCVAGMVLVNFPGDWVMRYHPLGHAEWDGATATDMIFPMFLLLAGFSMVVSFAARRAHGATTADLARRVVWRSALLLGLGLLLNAVPAFDWPTLHVFGVLQRIALCYLVGGLVVLATARRGAGFTVNVAAVVGFMLLVLVLVWAAQRYIDVPGYGAWRFDHDGNLGAALDRALVGNRHMSDWGGPARMWDADGLVSCITSIPNLLLGALAAAWVRRGRTMAATCAGMLAVAAVLVAAALALDPYLVINRKLWTGSFTLLSSGISLALFALCYLWLDRGDRGQRPAPLWLTPALVYGSNAILGFALYTILLALHARYPLADAHVPAYWLPGAAYAALGGWIGPYNASLLYGLLAVAIVLALLWPLYRKKIFLKL